MLGSLNKYDEPATILMEQILDAGKLNDFEAVLHRCLYLAARALADHVAVSDSTHKVIIAALLAVVREAPLWECMDALQAAGQIMRDEYLASELLAACRDQRTSPQKRSAIAETIGTLGFADRAALRC